MNLKQHIRKVLKEETLMRTSDRDYSRLIKKTVLNYVDFDICKMVVDKLDEVKNQYYVIMMVEKPLKTSYREELQDYLNDMIPLTIYVSIADGMNCKKYMGIEHPKQLSESKIPPQVIRRHHLIDKMFENMRSRYKRLFCNYRNPNILLGVLYERTLSDLYHAWFSETVSDDDWDFASEYIQKYLIDKYEKDTIDLWGKRCKNKGPIRKEEETEGVGGYAAPAFEMKPDHVHFKHQYNEETELTEKCWKGYAQKGMKTMFGKRYPNCVKKKNKSLKEYWTPKEEDYSNIESAINKIIPKRFSWFKEIEINSISYSEFSNTLTIYGELKVDEEWGAKQWREYYEYKPFPSNSGWEEEDPVRLGDIIGKGELDDLNDELELIVSSVGGYSIIDTMRLGQLKLYFV